MYGEGQIPEAPGTMLGAAAQRPTITQRLEARRDGLRQDLEAVEAALARMKDNPEAASLVDTLSKLGHF